MRFESRVPKAELKVLFKLPRSLDVKEIAMLLAFKKHVESITIGLTDEFERRKQFTWRKGE